MGINKTEAKVLFENKIREGKSYDEAEFEIARDKQFLVDTKDLKKQVSHLIYRLEKAYIKIERLRVVNKDLKREKFVSNLKNFEDNDEKATTFHLSRMLGIIEEGRINLNDLRKTCMLSVKVCQNGLGFLQKFNIIELTREGRTTFIELRRRGDESNTNRSYNK